MNARRKMLLGAGAALLAAPLRPLAQQREKVRRIGFMAQFSAPSVANWLEAFRAGLRERGYVEGGNLVVEYRWAEGKYERLESFAAELVQLKVELIVANGTPSVRAAQKATATLPIIMANVSDPVGNGLVKSLMSPGGNITGMSNVAGDLSRKHLELLLDVKPRPARVAVLANPGNPSHALSLKSLQAVEKESQTWILPVEATNPQEIESGFARMAKDKAGAVIVLGDGLLLQQRRQILELMAKYRLLSIEPFREFAEAGGLMSYGPDETDMWRRVANHVAKILKGAKPGDLPVELPTKYQLAVNLKTARALGVTIPQSILVRADKVIE